MDGEASEEVDLRMRTIGLLASLLMSWIYIYVYHVYKHDRAIF